jgi:surfeit locus 1 family protein
LTPPPPRRRATRSTTARIALALCAAFFFAGFVALGTWQVERRAWKLDLIARVDARVHAPAAAAPGLAQWSSWHAAADEYRHVRVSGRFLPGRETLVQASTELGAGFWVLAPLRLQEGGVVLVNRGFVPPEARDPAARGAKEPDAPVTLTGLLRLTEPGGAFLRHNDPGANRWYSRDVQAIAAARGLHDVAPFFIDADAAPASPGAPRSWPAGGLTVIRFPNNHLVYAITWYALALMAALAGWRVAREPADHGTRRIDENAELP